MRNPPARRPRCTPSTASPQLRPGPTPCRPSVCALLLPLLLTACGSPLLKPAPEVVRILPPAELQQDCPRPAVDMSNNGALLQSLLSCNAQIVKCNLDRAALRTWAETSQAPP